MNFRGQGQPTAVPAAQLAGRMKKTIRISHHHAGGGRNETLDCAPASWTAVASSARHRFSKAPDGCECATALRKRRRRCALPAHSKTLLKGALLVWFGICMGGGALQMRAAADGFPAFDEISGLVRSNLAGATPEQLNRVAVEGFLKELSPRVLLVSNANESISSGAPAGVIDTRTYRQNVGYLQLGAINEGASIQVHARYQELNPSNRLSGLVLDLREATGDDYAAALQVANLFLAHEVPLLNWGEGLKSSTEKKDAILLPVAVLINRQTSGAGEALAGMLRQSGVGLLIGNRTSGTAGIQRAFPLANGEWLKITVANIQLGDAQMLSVAGLKPDLEVTATAAQETAVSGTNGSPATASDLEGETDTNATPARMGMNEADLVRRWRGEMLSAKDLEVPSAKQGPESHDPVLLRALDLMDGLAILRSWQR